MLSQKKRAPLFRYIKIKTATKNFFIHGKKALAITARAFLITNSRMNKYQTNTYAIDLHVNFQRKIQMRKEWLSKWSTQC